jgi:hypothetical protein
MIADETTRIAASGKGAIDTRASFPKIGKRANPAWAPARAAWTFHDGVGAG